MTPNNELCAACAAAAQRKADSLQAKVDALMLEYCPEEMTPEQVEEWGQHQRPADAALEAAKSVAVPPTSEFTRLIDSLEKNRSFGSWVTPGFDVHNVVRILRATAVALEAAKPAAVPAGYVLVPVEPTDEMLWAAKKSRGGYREMYGAMLAASKGKT